MANEWRNRIVDNKVLPASALLDNAKNWRIHPEAQRKGLVKILDKVGKVAPLLCYNSTRYGGLTLYGGHLRKDVDPNETWPVAIADLTDEEADFVIATLDAVTPMVEIDHAILDSLVADIGPQHVDIEAILATLGTSAVPNFQPVDISEQPRLDQKKPITCPECGAEFVPKG